MPFLSIVIPLSANIRQSLERLCHGLEQIEWAEERDLCIQLQQIEIKNQGLMVEIRENLHQVALPPFQVSLQGICVDKGKRGRGTVWVNVVETEEMNRLCKELDRNLKNLEIIKHDDSPRVILGKFQSIALERLANYLEANAAFTLPSFTVDSFALLESHQTAKRNIFIPIQKFSLI